MPSSPAREYLLPIYYYYYSHYAYGDGDGAAGCAPPFIYFSSFLALAVGRAPIHASTKNARVPKIASRWMVNMHSEWSGTYLLLNNVFWQLLGSFMFHFYFFRCVFARILSRSISIPSNIFRIIPWLARARRAFAQTAHHQPISAWFRRMRAHSICKWTEIITLFLRMFSFLFILFFIYNLHHRNLHIIDINSSLAHININLLVSFVVAHI